MTASQVVEDILVENAAHVQRTAYRGSTEYILRQYRGLIQRKVRLSIHANDEAVVRVNMLEPSWDWNASLGVQSEVEAAKINLDFDKALAIEEILMDSMQELEVAKVKSMLADSDGWLSHAPPEYVAAMSRPVVISEPVEPTRKWWNFKR